MCFYPDQNSQPVINMESHVFSCYLGVIAFAIGKIALSLLMQLPCLLLMQFCTRIHVITHTNCAVLSVGKVVFVLKFL